MDREESGSDERAQLTSNTSYDMREATHLPCLIAFSESQTAHLVCRHVVPVVDDHVVVGPQEALSFRVLGKHERDGGVGEVPGSLRVWLHFRKLQAGRQPGRQAGRQAGRYAGRQAAENTRCHGEVT